MFWTAAGEMCEGVFWVIKEVSGQKQTANYSFNREKNNPKFEI